MLTNEKVHLKHSKFSLCSELEDSRSRSSNMYFIHQINYIGKYINKYRYEGDYMLFHDQSVIFIEPGKISKPQAVDV